MCTIKDFTFYCKIFSIYASIISVVIFEMAYKKDRFKLAVIGIEVLVTAIITAFIPYIYAYQERAVRGVVMTVPLLYAVYFLTKTSLYYVSKQKQYRDESITDIKEILDDSDEFSSYIDDESSSKLIKEEKENKENKEVKEKKSRKVKNKKDNNKKEEE